MSLNLKVFLLLGVLLTGSVALSAIDIRLPGDNQGYEPVQPIAFSHRVQPGEIGMDCQYCHSGARRSRFAGVPSASVCMNCHAVVTSDFNTLLEEKALAEAQHREPKRIVSAELAKLYDALALDENLEPIPGQPTKPIEWVRVHNLPDFVYFDHRPHVARKIACETCHGPVQSMERMSQFAPLSMGWCISCHRDNAAELDTALDAGLNMPKGHLEQHATTDCVSCHL